MQIIKKRIIVYFAICVAVTSFFLMVPGYKLEVTPLGSVLSAFFYSKHSLSEPIYPTFKQHITAVSDFKLKKFYKHLDWDLKEQTIDFESDVDATWQLFAPNGTSKKNYLLYWQTIRPHIKAFYNKYIPPVMVNKPIVHFRCSDAPFVTHPLYHLTKSSTVKWMAQGIKHRGYDEVILLSCNKHRKVKNNSCAKYLQFYIDLLNKNGVQVTTQCHDVYTDFALMIYSPLLISLNPSSFSFMAGISKDPNDYFSCNLGRELDGQYLLQNQADWHMAHDIPLLHKDVINYNDVATVLKQLQS